MGTKKTIKLIDVIHLYVGQIIASYWLDTLEYQTLRGVVGRTAIIEMDGDVISESIDLSYKHKKGYEPKLVLRRLSELKREEVMKGLGSNDTWLDDGFDSPVDWLIQNVQSAPYEMVQYCIEQGFDVFGLIESGQAIDRKTI